MAKFKLNQEVMIKEVYKRFGRTEKQVEVLEEIKDKQLKGKVLSIDDSDNNLNIYVSFEGKLNVWLNQDELEVWKTLTISLPSNPIKPIKKTEKELSDKIKAKLFDKLVKVEGYDINLLYEDWLKEETINQMVTMYTELTIDILELSLDEKLVERIVDFVLNEMVLDFDITIEEIREKLLLDLDDK